MTPEQDLQQALNAYHDMMDMALLRNVEQVEKNIRVTQIVWEGGMITTPPHSFDLETELADIKEIDYDFVWRANL